MNRLEDRGQVGNRWLRVDVLIAVAAMLALASERAAAMPVDDKLKLVSVGVGQGNGDSEAAAVSANGRYVVFVSFATNLVAGDLNGKEDVFARDLKTGQTTRVSVDSAGNEGNGDSDAPAISGNGRYVAFRSAATNLVAGDDNGREDVFVRDLKTGQTTRVSVGSTGIDGNGESDAPAISGNGRYVAFRSAATNLVAGDDNGKEDVFVRDLKTGQTTRVSVDSAGNEGNGDSDAPAISGNGRYVAFRSVATNLVAGDDNGKEDVFVRDLKTSQTARVSVDSEGIEGKEASFTAAISANGRFATFWSHASNLVPGDGNEQHDVFVRDLMKGQTTRASLTAPGTQGNAGCFEPVISANGRYVAFWSYASSLVPGDNNGKSDVFVRDQKSDHTTRVSVDSAGMEGNGDSSHVAISANGRYVAFRSNGSNLVAGDANGTWDVFVRDLKTGKTTRVSVDSVGGEGNGESSIPAISANGRYVAFRSFASNLVAGDGNGTADVFVRDLKTGKTSRVSVDSAGNEGNGESSIPAISANGRYVAFSSFANNLVLGDGNGTADVFVRDLKLGQTTRVSVDSAEIEGNGDSAFPAISANGRFVSFSSAASNLVAGDASVHFDVFVRDMKTGQTTCVSADSGGMRGNANSVGRSISANGRYVAFQSFANNLVSGDENGKQDVFVRDLKTGLVTRVSVDSAGNGGNSNSSGPAISANGRYVAFSSLANNLVAGDGNAHTDVFVRDLK